MTDLSRLEAGLREARRAVADLPEWTGHPAAGVQRVAVDNILADLAARSTATPGLREAAEAVLASGVGHIGQVEPFDRLRAALDRSDPAGLRDRIERLTWPDPRRNPDD